MGFQALIKFPCHITLPHQTWLVSHVCLSWRYS